MEATEAEKSVCVWPCGTWCRWSDSEGFAAEVGMSDDYVVITLPCICSDEAIEAIVVVREQREIDVANHPIWMGFDSTGLVFINIRGVDYTYKTDAALIPRIRNKFVHAPWKALKYLISRCYWYSDGKGVLHECA